MDSHQVEYRSIENYPGYRVGSDGTIWSQWKSCCLGKFITDKWKKLKTPPSAKGYPRVNLATPERKQSTFFVHKLVLCAFVGPKPSGMECRHLNGIKTDCSVGNLSWGTPSENYEDNRRLGAYSNKQRNVMIDHEGKIMSLKEWCSFLGLPYSTIYQRVRICKMDFADAISRPMLSSTKRR